MTENPEDQSSQGQLDLASKALLCLLGYWGTRPLCWVV